MLFPDVFILKIVSDSTHFGQVSAASFAPPTVAPHAPVSSALLCGNYSRSKFERDGAVLVIDDTSLGFVKGSTVRRTN